MGNLEKSDRLAHLSNDWSPIGNNTVSFVQQFPTIWTTEECSNLEDENTTNLQNFENYTSNDRASNRENLSLYLVR